MTRQRIRSVLSLLPLGVAAQVTCTRSSPPKTGGSIWASLIYLVRLRQARNHCQDHQIRRIGDVRITDGVRHRHQLGHLCQIRLALRLSINHHTNSSNNLLPLHRQSSPRTRGLSSYEICHGPQMPRKRGKQTTLSLGALKNNPDPPSCAVLHSQRMWQLKQMRLKQRSMARVLPSRMAQQHQILKQWI